MVRSEKAILQVEDLQAHFYTRRGIVRAVDHISFQVFQGETLGIVGESGSGKSVTQLSLLGLLPKPPLKIVGGHAKFHGTDLLTASPAKLRTIRGDRISMIFQEPMTSLNPYLKISTQLMEPLQIHKNASRREAWLESCSALERVGISSPDQAMRRYPHEFSGGMRQRVMIAMALTTKPELLIADEPTTALDVTIQAQILDLLKKLQRETGMAIILITHDLGVIANMADRVLVMYAGRVFEKGQTDDIFYKSEHPYTSALLRSTPRIDIKQGALPAIEGQPPDLTQLRGGCPFVDRCGYAHDPCADIFPNERVIGNEHYSYCHLKELP